MANEHIFNNSLIITGSVTASNGFYGAFSGDGSGLTGITASAEWDGTRDGNAEITGSLVVSGSSVLVDLTRTTKIYGSTFSGSFEGDGSGLTNLNLNGYQASGSELTGSFTGSFVGDGSGLTGLAVSTPIYEIGLGANSIQPASASFNATASGNFSVIGGGISNTVNGSCSFIGGGSSNTVEQTYGSIVGGSTNCITGTGDSNTILNGFGNTISGSANSVIAGATNTLADPGVSNFVFGQGMTIGAGSSIGTSNLYTQNIHITGSTTANGILKISRRTTTPSPAQEGMIIASGSAGASVLYYYDGSTWNALF